MEPYFPQWDSNRHQGSDLGPLLLHHTALRDIENHSCHGQEEKRHHAGHFLQLLDLLVNHGDGQLVLPGIMGYETVGRKRLFDPVLHGLPVAAGLQLKQKAVTMAFLAEQLGHGPI